MLLLMQLLPMRPSPATKIYDQNCKWLLAVRAKVRAFSAMRESEIGEENAPSGRWLRDAEIARLPIDQDYPHPDTF